MKALIAALIVLPMSISILNFDEVTVENTEQLSNIEVVEEVEAEAEIPFEEMTVDQRADADDGLEEFHASVRSKSLKNCYNEGNHV